MGRIRPSPPVKLFVGILSSIGDLFTAAEESLAAIYGPVDLRSHCFAFDLTHYYNMEMGAPIERRFVSFENLIRADRLSEIKIRTNELEETYRTGLHGVPRPLNLDPGYIELSKVVLASTKNFYHRILLSQGIYAEVTLRFESGRWQPFPWTFPDFRSGRYDAFFNTLRARYQEQLQSVGCQNAVVDFEI